MTEDTKKQTVRFRTITPSLADFEEQRSLEGVLIEVAVLLPENPPEGRPVADLHQCAWRHWWTLQRREVHGEVLARLGLDIALMNKSWTDLPEDAQNKLLAEPVPR